MSALQRLAIALGVPPDYRDTLGQVRDVPQATLQAVCAALGYPAADDAEAQAACERLARARWCEILPPVVARRGDPAAIDVTLSARQPFGATAITWQVVAESGASHAGETHADTLPLVESGEAGERRRLSIPIALPPGYHLLRVHVTGTVRATGTARLIVAPARAYQPPELATGLWALAAQLYALRSAADWGIGDFTALADLMACAGRCAAAGVGVNPLHSLFLDDPERASPYSPASRLFVNPLYLDVAAIEDFAEVEALPLAALRTRIASLRASGFVDYAAVAAIKREVLELLFASFRMRHLASAGEGEGKEEGDARAQEFRAFQRAGGEALRRFAIFEALRERLGADDPSMRDWRRWPPDLARPDAPGVAAFVHERGDRVAFFEYLQWQADRQLARVAARAAAAAMPVGLYRDLAVGVDVAGADAWAEQDVIVAGFTVGAPPDAWAPHGQNWGFPPLDPLALRRTGHQVLVDVLRANMRHAGALRIDHVLGLMRTFWIPDSATAADGAYVHYPFDELLAVVVLESHRNRCLVIGEDLGTLPEGLREALEDAGLLSYRLLYFERGDGGRFLRPGEYPAQALAAVTTHDLPTLVGYWTARDIATRDAVGGFPDPAGPTRARAEREQDRARLREALQDEALLAEHGDDAPVDAAHRYLARSRASLMLVQIEDALHEPDQVNLPGTDREHPNWRRRLPVTVAGIFADTRVHALLEAIAAERPRRGPPPPAAAAPRRNAWPVATYRVQLNKDFTFADLQRVLPYLDTLGVSHVYVSPFLRARPGSMHGYDIIDHNAINEEIGGAEGFDRLSAALAALDMGLILDFVPNHMGIGQAENTWWLDVLQWGAASPYAPHFDIDWQAPKRELAGRVLLPVLGDHYGNVLERGELVLRFEGGAFKVRYFEHGFPVRPRHAALIIRRGLETDASIGQRDRLDALAAELATLRPEGESRLRQTGLWKHGRRLQADLAELAQDPAVAGWLARAAQSYDGKPGEPESFRMLHQLLERQAYRLAFWRVASDEINYRRFFDINDLVGLRQEVPTVFADSHRLVARLIAERKVQGLRLDHVDGLFDPAGYCRQLRALVAQARAGDAAPFPVHVEKILAQHERLPGWPVEGTTGYDFLALLNRVFVDPDGEHAIDEAYRRFAGEAPPFERIALECRHQVMDTLLSSELNVLSRELDRISEQHWRTRDYTVERLRLALRETVANFPVYRTYVTRAGAGEEDRRHIRAAVARARRRWIGPDREVLDFIESVLTGDLVKGRASGFNRNDVLRFAMRVQQYTAPVMAKAIEDTAFYRFPRLLSLNEVGGDPQRFAVPPGAFHAANEERRRAWPHALLATATHDTKRGEDARLRLDVLSEIPEQWTQAVRRWRRFNRSRRVETDAGIAPRRVDEYMIYQALLGAWPAELTRERVREAPQELRERLHAYVTKALREAKLVSSWHDPNEAYERGCYAFIDAILGEHHPNLFLDDFQALAAHVALVGALSALSQTVLRCLVPGIPDAYQGTELWDLSLVDPDNRRPVDFAARAQRLAALDAAPWHLWAADPAQIAAMMRDWPSGDVKLHVLRRALALRGAFPALIANGSYEPIAAHGVHAARVLAFVRRSEGAFILVAAGRLLASIMAESGEVGAAGWGAADWGGTALELPASTPRVLVDVLTGTRHAAGDPIPVAALLGTLPVAVLTGSA